MLIQEVLYDPPADVPDPGGEWIVLRNVTDQALRLDGWRLRDSQAETGVPSVDAPPGALVLILAFEAVEGQALPEATLRVTLPARIGNGLNNEGDSLTLLDGGGTPIDAVSWGDDRSVFDPPVPVAEPGSSIRRYTSEDTDSASDWAKPTDEPARLLVRPEVAGAPGDESSPSGPVEAPGDQLSPPEPPIPETTDPPAALETVDQPLASAEPADQVPPRSEAAGEAQAIAPAGGAAPAVGSSDMVVLSEVAPAAGWVELYNRGSTPVDLHGWALVDGAGAATMLLPELPLLPAHGFVVFEAAALRLTEPDRFLVLRRADGTVADMVAVGRVRPGRSLSRYPVHGGDWTADTLLTAGHFNRLAADTVPTPAADSTEVPSPSVALQAVDAPLDERLFFGGALVVLALLLVSLLRERRAP